ncbi:MAG: hypothetical protein ACOVRM_11090 [Planctomycetaceae bacterium]
MHEGALRAFSGDNNRATVATAEEVAAGIQSESAFLLAGAMALTAVGQQQRSDAVFKIRRAVRVLCDEWGGRRQQAQSMQQQGNREISSHARLSEETGEVFRRG